MKNNKVKVVVIQKSKITPKPKNPCIQNFITVRKDRPHGQGGEFLILMHISVTFSKQPSPAESLADHHMEELSIKCEIGNPKLIISNIYIPPASSCSNGYRSSIEYLLTTQDTLILSDFNTHYLSWYSRSTDGSDNGILNWDTPHKSSPERRTEFAGYLISISFPHHLILLADPVNR